MSKKVKTIELIKDKSEKITPKKLSSKTNFIINQLESSFIDTNSSGDLFLTATTSVPQISFLKWDFLSQSSGVYLIKNTFSELFLTSSSSTDVVCLPFISNCPNQKWVLYETTEKECFLIQSYADKLEVDVLNGKVFFMNETSLVNDVSKSRLFKIFPKIIEK